MRGAVVSPCLRKRRIKLDVTSRLFHLTSRRHWMVGTWLWLRTSGLYLPVEGGSLEMKWMLFSWEAQHLCSALASVWPVLAARRPGGPVWRVPQAAGAHPAEGRADSQVQHSAHVSISGPSCPLSVRRQASCRCRSGQDYSAPHKLNTIVPSLWERYSCEISAEYTVGSHLTCFQFFNNLLYFFLRKSFTFIVFLSLLKMF